MVRHPAERDRLIAANFLDAYTWFQRRNDAHTVHAAGGMVCAYAPGGLSDFNVALPGPSPALPDPFSEALRLDCQRVCAFFASLNAPFSCWVQGAPGAPEAPTLGFAARHAYTGQYLDLRQARYTTSAGLTLRRITGLDDLAAFAELIALGWSMPSEPYREFFSAQAEHLLHPDALKRLYLGLAGDVPACCMELFVQPEARIAGIYYVTTHPEYRRRGLAAALQSHVLRQAAREGCTGAVVISEPDECRLLGRLGFVDCSPWYEYLHA